MFNTFFIQTNKINELKIVAGLKFQANICITNLISLQNSIYIEELIAFYYNEEINFNFNILITDCDLMEVASLHNLALLFAHPRYHRGNNGIHLFLDTKDSSANAQSIISEFMVGQGYSNIEVILLPPKLTHLDESYIFLLNGNSRLDRILLENIISFYKNYLSQNYNTSDYFIVNFKQDFLVEEAVKEILDAEIEFKEGNPYLATLINKLYLEGLNNQILRFRADSLKEELAILQELFLANAKNNEIEYILNFYHKEYEALPLWYKRFGHLIKVCMGKRTVQSLFKS